MRTLALALALSFAAVTGAAAQSATTLTLASAEGAPAKVIIDGSVWKCEGAACTTTGGKAQSADRACRRTVAKLGAVTAFTYRGEALSDDALAACNTSARG